MLYYFMTKKDVDLEILRHSTSHVMAHAVQELFPGVKLGIGPAIENGFYYDFDLPQQITPEDLTKIEEKMREIIKKEHKFERQELPKQKAIELFESRGEKYKVELLNEIEADPMMQRIYGTVFPTLKELDTHLKNLEEAKKRDHRKLGRELDLFSLHEEAGAGLVYWHPKGAVLRGIIEDFLKTENRRRGYEFVTIPHLAKIDLWNTSGHSNYYRENMYFMKIDEQEYVVKPMNCPGHILIFKRKTRSYRDLPIRYFELGTVYRYEKSGVLHGLLRVRGFTQDDAHIFCREDQLETEIIDIIDFISFVMRVFGFEFKINLSTRPEKFAGTPENWERATAVLEKSLQDRNLPFEIDPGAGVFYGPKIDIKLKDSLGREWQGPTVQVDFNLPQRFDLTYIDENGQAKTPVMVHRAILGSLERFIGALIENYGGAFPVWLAPTQVSVLPISEKYLDYAEKVAKTLQESDVRVEVDRRGEKIGAKIRDAQLQKVPYMLIVGEKEQTAGTVAIRERSRGDLGAKSLPDFLFDLKPQMRYNIQ
jgi:threonyl-tRNA synthetase